MLKTAIVICTLYISSGFATQEVNWAINEIFDESLEALSTNLKKHNDGYVKLGKAVIGGYTLEGASLGDLTTLKRNGNITFSSELNSSLVTVSGKVELPNMIVRGGKITTPGKTINNPAITFNGFDGFAINFRFIFQNKKCEKAYPIERSYWTRGIVLLTSDTEQFKNVDITKFIQLYEHDLSLPIQTAMSKAFADFFDDSNMIMAWVLKEAYLSGRN